MTKDEDRNVLLAHEKSIQWLRDQIILALRLEYIGNGRHTLRDENNWLVGEFWIEGIWLAFIEPSFEPYSALAAIHEKETSTVAFVVDDGKPPAVAKFDANWTDPVVLSLRSLDLFGIENGLSLDGIGYDLEISTGVSKTTIYFGNPTTKPFIDLTISLYSVATELSICLQDSRTVEYLKIWKKYLPSSTL